MGKKMLSWKLNSQENQGEILTKELITYFLMKLKWSPGKDFAVFRNDFTIERDDDSGIKNFTLK